MNGVGIQVAFNAKSYRAPEPRFSSEAFPRRSSFGRIQLAENQLAWHRLEDSVKYTSLATQHALIGGVVPILITMFHSTEGIETISNQQKNGTDVEDCT